MTRAADPSTHSCPELVPGGALVAFTLVNAPDRHVGMLAFEFYRLADHEIRIVEEATGR